ncbi:helix-turn-helix domain-containing protein [Chitinophaga sp.]|uniref:helix-turn-helix domain-containing protein n=1 Tax=Chitinophaga sp. TaxID=1869181 RepID=UPI0031E40572
MPVQLYTYFLQRRAFPESSQVLPPPALLNGIVESCRLFDGHDGACWFSDGRPCMVFVLNEEAQVQAGWCSPQLLENVHQTTNGHALLIVRFTPTGFYRLAPAQMRLLRHQHRWAFEELFGENWVAALQPLRGVKQVAAQVMQLLAAQLKHPAPVPPLLEEALQLISRAKGNIVIDDLVRQLRLNYKWLERKCLAVTGIAPKEYARLQRFLHAWLHLVETNGQDLMGTALDHGYCDQHHFSKEFRRFTGKPPLAYLSAKQ